MALTAALEWDDRKRAGTMVDACMRPRKKVCTTQKGRKIPYGLTISGLSTARRGAGKRAETG